ncbi:MAG: alkaline phosphatase family protein [Sandaracinus sp.]
MSARHLVIGIDGADWDVVDAIGAARLPTLASLRARGAWARLESVVPPATLPNWTTFLTGVDPGAHGVFDFTRREGYRVRFTSGAARAVPTWLARLDAAGLSCAMLSFPGTYPPEKLAHGVVISGWDSPVAFEADRSFVSPADAFDALTERFGPLRFDEVDEFDTASAGFHERLGDALALKVERKTELFEHVLGERAWDVLACYFGETDTASHHLAAFFDPRSPRRPAAPPARAVDGIPRVYEAIDRALARLMERAGPGVELTLVSDHGSGPSSDRVVFLDRALEAAGLLRFLPRRAGAAISRLAKEAALTVLPPRLKERAFGAMGRALPGWLESRARFGAIDFSRTKLFSEELNYFPSICVNERGREPAGTVDPSERPAMRRQLETAMRAIVDPWTGERIVRAVHAREDLYFGPEVRHAPDFVLELALDERGASYNVMPSGGPGPVVDRLPEHEWLGRKGRSLQGAHRSHGLFLAAGPSVRAAGEVTAHIADASATCLARIGSRLPESAGRVLSEILTSQPAPVVLPAQGAAPRAERPELARTEARLRALGYFE